MVSMLGPSHLMGDIYIPRYNNIEENLAKLETFIPEDTDYFLCSYPKSGNGTHFSAHLPLVAKFQFPHFM